MNTQSLLMRCGGQAVFYTVGLLIVTGLVSRWGVWYSFSLSYRLQTEALLRGKLALSENPVDLNHDLTWSQQGVHQVWGLGVPLWRLPLEAVAKLLGFAAFPDRIAFGLFAALVAFLALGVWTTAWSSNSQQQRPADLVWRRLSSPSHVSALSQFVTNPRRRVGRGGGVMDLDSGQKNKHRSARETDKK